MTTPAADQAGREPDSLIIANVIELMMDGSFSTVPGLENTIFALDDGNESLDLGAPQPTVDLLASLITDGERPQGDRSSNRTLSIPIAISSDSRDNLTLAREFLLRIINQEKWTLRYEMGNSDAGPVIFDCWRAMPSKPVYAPVVEEQYACQITITFEALPFGKAESPNQITFASPAAGTAPPPAPILLDGFDSVSPGQTSPWLASNIAVAGNTSIESVASGELSIPFYQANLATLDLTTGGTGMNNIIQFWAGFASEKYYGNWHNHKSEVTFAFRLYDSSGRVVNGHAHGSVVHSNDLSNPKWTHIGIRMPVTNNRFDYTKVVRYDLRVYNKSINGTLYLKDSIVFIDSLYAVSPSSAVANVARGGIYTLNGVEGSARTPVSIAASQQGSTGSTTWTRNVTDEFIAPAGVVSVDLAGTAVGGPGGPSNADNGAGGGGEYVMRTGVPVTPGKPYTANVSDQPHPLLTGPFTGTWTHCGSYVSTGATNNATAPFGAAVAVGNTVIVQVVLPNEPQIFGGTVTVTDDAGNGTYKWIANAEAPDGTFVAIYAAFNIQNAITTSNNFTVAFSPVQIGIAVYVDYCPGELSWVPSKQVNGTSDSPYIASGGWIDPAHSEITNPTYPYDPSFWVTVTGATLAESFSAPAGGVSTMSVDFTATGATVFALTNFIAVTENSKYVFDMLAYLTAGSSRAVSVGWTWYDATGASLGTGTLAFAAHPANAWTWARTVAGYTSPTTAPAGAVKVQYAIIVTGCTAGDKLSLQAQGFKRYSPDNSQYLAIVGNNSGLNVVNAPPGWTLLRSVTNGAGLAFDTYWIKGNGIGGVIFGRHGMYSSSIPFGVSLVRLSDSGGCVAFTGDDGSGIVAHGGQPASATSAAGGLGGTGSDAPVHNDGGSGAAGTGSAGGGAGSSGGTGGTTFVDDNDASISWWAASAPPTQITNDFSSMSAGHLYGTNIFNVNGSVVKDPQMTVDDRIVVAVVSTVTPTPVIGVTDTQGNTYQFVYKAVLPGNTWQVQLFKTGTSTNQLTVGDEIHVDPGTTTPGNYAIMAYVFKEAIGIEGVGHGLSGEVDGSFTGITHTDTFSGLVTPPNAHFILAVATDNIAAYINSAARYQDNLDSPQLPANLPAGSNVLGQSWPANAILQAFWKEADSNGAASSTSLVINRLTSGTMAYVGTTFHMDTDAWATSGGAPFHNNSHHFSNKAGKHFRITVSAPQIQIVGKKGPDQGTMLVSVDNGPWQEIDNYRAATVYQVVLFDTGKITNISHTIDVVTTGRHNQSSTNSYVDIDGYQVISAGAGLNGTGSTGGIAVTGGGAGANGATVSGNNGSAGGSPGGGGSGGLGAGKTGGLGGPGQIQITYTGAQPSFKTLVLHKPNVYGSKTLMPYIACTTQAVPTSDMIQSMYPGQPAHFNGTYSFYVGGTFDSPTVTRTLTVTLTEYEDDPDGILPGSTSTQSLTRDIIPNTDAKNGLVNIAELTLPNKLIPPENNQARYKVSINSSNPLDTIQDILILDTMGQTIIINEDTAYTQYSIDEPDPDVDIGYVLGSQFGRSYAISVLDEGFPTGGPIMIEPGDNILFAYSREGAPALDMRYFPRYFIGKTVS